MQWYLTLIKYIYVICINNKALPQTIPTTAIVPYVLKMQNVFNQSCEVHITLLVIYSLESRHICKYTHADTQIYAATYKQISLKAILRN